MIKHTRRNRRSAFAGFFSSNTMVGVQSSVLANVSAGNRSAHVLRMQPETLLLEDRVMPVVNLSVSDLTIVEGDAGTKDAVFTVTRTGKPDDLNVAFQVSFATQDGTGSDAAKAGVDYVADSGVLTFQAGESTKAVSVAVIGNNIFQGSRSFSLSVSNAQPLKGPQIQFGDVITWEAFGPNFTDIMVFGNLNGKEGDEKIVKIMNLDNNGNLVDLCRFDVYNESSDRKETPFSVRVTDAYSNPVPINSLQVSDLDQDGYDDVIITSTPGIMIYWGNPDLSKLETAEHTIVPVDGGALKTAMIDTNDDGKTEIVAVGGNGAYLYKANSSRDYSLSQIIDSGFCSDIISNDFNGDTRNDIVIMKEVYVTGTPPQYQYNYIDGSYINDGMGRMFFQPSEKMNFIKYDVYNNVIYWLDISMTSQDFNGDGIDDIAVNQTKVNGTGIYSTGQNQAGCIRLIAGSPNGVLISKGVTQGFSYSNGQIGSADFNGDGIQDIAVSCPAGILLGKGDFTFTERTQFHDLTANTDMQIDYKQQSLVYNRLTVYDYNKDGLPDIYANEKIEKYKISTGGLSSSGNAVAAKTTSIYLSSGATTSNVPQFVLDETEGSGTWTVPIDINTDGFVDLLSNTRDTIKYILGQNYPVYTQSRTTLIPNKDVGAEFPSYHQTYLKDMNNDGYLDVLARSDDNFLIVSGLTFTVSHPYLTEGPGDDIFAADFNDDKLQDVAYTTLDKPGVYIAFSQGKGEYGNAEYIKLDAGLSRSTFCQDLNNDGKTDIIYYGEFGLQVIFSGSKDTISPLVRISFDTPVIIGDFEHDGIQDVIGIDNNQVVTIPLNSNGTIGMPVIRKTTDSTPQPGTAVDFADFNKDGIDDFVVFDSNSSMRFLQGGVDGLYDVQASPRKGPNGFHDHYIGDLNNDGKLDIVYSTNAPGDYMYIFNTTPDAPVFSYSKPAQATITDNDSPASIHIVQGNLQTTALNSFYKDPLQVMVQNSNGTPVSGVSVIYTTVQGSTGTNGAFAGQTTIISDNNGIAQATPLRANGLHGQFQVIATAGTGTNAPSVSFTEEVKIVVDYHYESVSIAEGDYGKSYLSFNVTRSGDTYYPSTVEFATKDATAIAGVDYQSVSGKLVYSAGELSKTVLVPILGNTKLQADRQFQFQLSNPYIDPTIPSVIRVPSKPADCLIIDDDAPQSVVIVDGDNQKMGIGAAFLKPLTVIVQNINGNPVSGVSVSFQVSVGSNLATAKFANSNSLISDANGRAVSSQLTAGQIPGTFQVIATATGNGQTAIGKFNETVIPLIQYTVADSSIIEGDTGTKQMVFTIRRGGSTSLVTTVDYSTVDGSAIAGTDYTSTFGKLTFAANEIAKKVTVPIFTNTIFQSDRAFQFALSNPVWIPGQDIVFQTPVASALGKITDDDNPQYISIVTGDQQSNLLGTDFATPLSVRVQNLNGSAVSGVPISFVIRPGIGDVNATFDSSDVLISDSTGTAVASRLTAGLTPGSFSVYATASGYHSSKSAIFQLTQRGKITYSIADSSVKEGDSGKTPMVFNITRSGSTWLDSSIDYKTVDGTAFAGTDYESASGRIYFAPNELTKTIRVNVIGNSTSQVDRSFGVALNLPAGINPQPNDFVLPPSPAQGTIMDDDSIIAAARFIKQSAPTPAPAPQPVLQSYSVQKGASSRSFVRYVDLVLNDVSAATNVISSIASSAPRIRLTNKGLSGTSNSPVSLQGFAKSNGTSVNIDFGTKGLGGSPTTSTADGSYLLEMDLDANGSYETSMRFHRLLGDVNGDKVVDGKDTSLANSSLNKSGFNLPADTNGDGKVNATDVAYIKKAQKRKILV